MIEFKSQFSKTSTKVIVKLSSESTLDEVLEALEGFLRAVGYSFNGKIDLIEGEENGQDPVL